MKEGRLGCGKRAKWRSQTGVAREWCAGGGMVGEGKQERVNGRVGAESEREQTKAWSMEHIRARAV